MINRSLIILVITVLWIFLLQGCTKETEPIKIGFAGCLTGRLSDLGVSGRDGVTLAVEQINAGGGINGRLVELIVKDDRQDPEVALQVDRELIHAGAAAIIGHMTSDISLAVLPLMNRKEILMISPTCNSSRLAGIDDHFIMMEAPGRLSSDYLVRYTHKNLGLRTLAGVYDLSNRAFAEDYYTNFKREFEKMGGSFSATETLQSGQTVFYDAIVKRLLSSNPDGVVIVTGALDAAMICQNLRKAGSNIPVVSSSWAMTSDFLQHGGSAVEKVIFAHTYNKEGKQDSFLKFRRQFRQRFGRVPSFGAAWGYEAAQVLFTGLAETASRKKLKGVILNRHIFQGLQEEIEIDRYGDAKRTCFIFMVSNNQITTIEQQRCEK